ncbi:2-dehydropantoate 2-reductase [Malassezia vespertilionis]|uniref:2-dehydropantoate 2-reductase n=1 Tax=Malassezia vespertilionis TaxID=2020962 RepID=A0A2N1J7R1_9BASI|nr:2-dehydropantoate 2-reductase [Malassezia vespertilionis]PKI82596.1 hypothetical protein MVES_003414 [Malassezia vespertilionis]WFD08481.1 2-dehydropantoate 2-reductase [Malassezia vespertilionis]
MRVLVVGAGAVGCFYASRLDPSAFVGLVCRSNYDAVHAHGISMKTSSFGDYHYQPNAVYAAAENAAMDGPWDFVLVATKVNTSLTAADIIASVVSQSTTIVLIQNGVMIESPFRARFPETPILSAVTVVAATLVEPNVAAQYRWTRISLGPYSDFYAHDDTPLQKQLLERATDAMRTLAQLWKNGGISDVEEHSARDIQLVRWHKLSINAAFNASSVLAGCIGNGEAVRDPYLRAHIKACMEEVLDATETVFGVPMPARFASPDKIIRSNEKNVGSKSSMLQDWEAHRPMELDAILKSPLELAEKHGVSMPRLQSMYALLRSAEAQRRA